MLLTRLIRTKRSDDASNFYGMQAEESLRWLKGQGITSATHRTALDLGCGNGFFGAQLVAEGYATTFSDEKEYIDASVPRPINFIQFDICLDDLAKLGRHDLVILSNVLEHLPDPDRILKHIPNLLNPGGVFYLCWTNWLSPYGGHEFTPYHYLGCKMATWLHESLPEKLLIDRRRDGHPHTLGQNLFPTYIGRTLRLLRGVKGLEVVDYVPRYYSELRWLAHVPVLREFVCWNFAVLIRRV
jgi:SAM-dependent methyltransferase